MADTNFRGPVNSMGSLEVDAATASVYPTDGPSMSYQGYAQPDIRSAPFAKDGFRPAQQPALMAGNVAWVVDNVPQARTTTQLAALQTVTSAVSLSLVTAQPAGVAGAANIAIGVPIIPVGTTVVQYVTALDFGFATGTTTANSTSVTVNDNSLFRVGQWIIVAGAANSSASRSLIAQVMSISTANLTGITISPAAATGLSNVPIGQGNLFGGSQLPPGTQFGPATASASGHSFAGAFPGGLGRIYNPKEMLTRNIVVSALTAVAYSALVQGYDLWGYPVNEIITTASQTTVASKRPIKYLGSIVSGTTVSSQYSIGLGDTVGMPFRVDEWDQIDITWNNSRITNANGFTAAFVGTQTGTSGDVRGSIQLSTAVLTGVLATAISPTATNGTGRLTVRQTFGVWNEIAGTPINTIPMFGPAQFTGST